MSVAALETLMCACDVNVSLRVSWWVVSVCSIGRILRAGIELVVVPEDCLFETGDAAGQSFTLDCLLEELLCMFNPLRALSDSEEALVCWQCSFLTTASKASKIAFKLQFKLVFTYVLVGSSALATSTYNRLWKYDDGHSRERLPESILVNGDSSQSEYRHPDLWLNKQHLWLDHWLELVPNNKFIIETHVSSFPLGRSALLGYMTLPCAIVTSTVPLFPRVCYHCAPGVYFLVVPEHEEVYLPLTGCGADRLWGELIPPDLGIDGCLRIINCYGWRMVGWILHLLDKFDEQSAEMASAGVSYQTYAF
ncbi:hypothetical protein Tco_0382025 [Tanacetum coccineum]